VFVSGRPLESDQVFLAKARSLSLRKTPFRYSTPVSNLLADIRPCLKGLPSTKALAYFAEKEPSLLPASVAKNKCYITITISANVAKIICHWHYRKIG